MFKPFSISIGMGIIEKVNTTIILQCVRGLVKKSAILLVKIG
jgi:hypothetical protein